jgi:processive 1,2-diacylglycerol beta-glucosyltransferase
MPGAATTAMPGRIAEERQRRRRPRAAATACGGWSFAGDAFTAITRFSRRDFLASQTAKGQPRRPHPFFSSLLDSTVRRRAVRLLILSASAGAGHARAGEALAQTARELDPAADVRHCDTLDLADSLYKRAYAGSFLQMVNRAPGLWGHFYKASDRPAAERRAREKLVRFFDRLEFARLRRVLRDFAPDAVVATHFLPCQVLAVYRRQGRFSFPLGVAVTDFDVHAFWVQPTADRFFVGSDELAARLAGRGIEPERIAATGIPIAPDFARPRDRAALRQRFGIAPEAPAVLVMGGGAGVGSLGDAVKTVLQSGRVHVLAVAGKNAALKRALENLPVPRGAALTVFGFVDPIGDLMAASDLAVTKSGGLTTAECLAMGLPMVVRDPIPGQEERNCDFVLEAGAGVKAHGLDSLRYKVGQLLADKARLSRMSEAARAAGRPGASGDIVRAMMKIAKRT